MSVLGSQVFGWALMESCDLYSNKNYLIAGFIQVCYTKGVKTNNFIQMHDKKWIELKNYV